MDGGEWCMPTPRSRCICGRETRPYRWTPRRLGWRGAWMPGATRPSPRQRAARWPSGLPRRACGPGPAMDVGGICAVGRTCPVRGEQVWAPVMEPYIETRCQRAGAAALDLQGGAEHGYRRVVHACTAQRVHMWEGNTPLPLDAQASRVAWACTAHRARSTGLHCRVGSGAGRRSAPGGWGGGRKALHMVKSTLTSGWGGGRHALHMLESTLTSGSVENAKPSTCPKTRLHGADISVPTTIQGLSFTLVRNTVKRRPCTVVLSFR